MVLNRFIGSGALLTRNIFTSAIRRSDHNEAGIVGSNLPFQIHNRYRLAFTFILFFGSGLGLPFYILRHMILSEK